MSPETSATFDVTTEDVEYRRHEGGPLLARLYLPQGAGPFPLLAEVHGGAWCRGDRLDEDRLNQALARRGIAVAALDFRMPPQAGYPASIADVNYGVRWLKSRAPQWRIRPEMVGLMGLSSGAHQAVLAAMRPRDPRYAALPVTGAAAGIDARAAFVVMCWPVIDPLGRYHYALELQASGRPYPEAIDRVIPDHLKYWGGEEEMAEGSPVLALERGEAVERRRCCTCKGNSTSCTRGRISSASLPPTAAPAGKWRCAGSPARPKASSTTSPMARRRPRRWTKSRASSAPGATAPAWH